MNHTNGKHTLKAPSEPTSAAEWVATLRQQQIQLSAQLNQVLGALAIADRWASSDPDNNEKEGILTEERIESS